MTCKIFQNFAIIVASDESGGEDYSFNSDDSMDQETSQSLISHSQTRVSDSSLAESSQSIIPHSQEQGLKPTEINPGIGDTVEVHMRKSRDGRLLTSMGKATQVDPDHPNRVKTHICRQIFLKVLKIITRHSTSMISNDTQAQSKTLDFAVLLVVFKILYCCGGGD